ncbi:hypothetical protein ABEB36_005137 [Hypothenemus hampei]|uniref:Juvenile hormone binding protein n=1 Tax=Hypothenemus hampei TaxID=57062 RepID=A0ABD1EX43_HYPHA
MNTLISILLCALFSTAYGRFENDTEVVYEFVNCSLRAIDKGIENLVPSHNPLNIRDISFEEEILGLTYHFELTNNYLYNLLDLELKQVNVTTYTNPDALNIDYDIYWPLLNMTGNFAWSFEILNVTTGGNGTYEIDLEHTDFFGLFNLTKPGQEDKGIVTHLDDFTLNVTVKDVAADVVGAGPEWLTDEAVKLAVKTLMNHIPASIADILKEDRFNDFWINHPERIEALLTWCYDNPAQ